MPLDLSGMGGGQIGMINLGDMLGKMGQRTKRRRLKVPAAFAKLIEEEADRRLDQDEISREALANAEANGIVFLDEVDKIATSDVRGGSVSREGVQRDLLPRSEEHTSELQSLMRISYAVFCLKQNTPPYKIINRDTP